MENDIKSEPGKQPPAKPEIDPEHLLKMIDIQIAQQRNQRTRKESDGRSAFRIWSLVLIVVGMIFALMALQWMLSQMAPVDHDSPSSPDGVLGSPAPTAVVEPAGR